MNAAGCAQAHVVIPKESLRLLTELVAKLGGRLIAGACPDESFVVSPPLAENDRIGILLKAARLRADMTQKELAAAIGVPQSHISEFEKNRRRIPRAKAEELARVLETTPNHFLPRGLV